MSTFYIIRDGEIIDRVEASSEEEAMEAAVVVTDGQFDDIMDSKDYEAFVAKRGADDFQAMDKEIKAKRKAIIEEENPVMSSLFPYTAKKMAETGEDVGFTDGLNDVGSLPGRSLYQMVNPSSGVGMTSEELAAQGNWGGALITDPAVGWSAALAPLGVAGGGALGSLLNLRYAVPVGEALGMATLSTAPTAILDENATAGSVATEGLLNLFGGAAGAGLSKLTRKAATSRMRSVLAKEGIENVPDYALDDVYDQLTRVSLGSTPGSMSGASRKAMEASNRRIAGSLDLPVSNVAPKPEVIQVPSGTGKNKNLFVGLTNESAIDNAGQSPSAVRGAFREISENLSEMSKTMKLSDAQEQVYQSRIKRALDTFNRLVSKSETKRGGKFSDEAFRRDMLDLLNSVGDIPGAGEKLAETVSGGYRNALIKAITGMDPALRGKSPSAPYTTPLANAIKSSGPQGALSRLYAPAPVELEHPLAALTKAVTPSAPNTSIIAGRMAAPAGLSFGADWLRKMYEQGDEE